MSRSSDISLTSDLIHKTEKYTQMFSRVSDPKIVTAAVHQFSVSTDYSAFFELQSDFSNIGFTQNAAPKRKLEFIAGRFCASRALSKVYSKNDFQIGVSDQRAPIWPEGWTGSITHTEGFVSAAVAKLSCLRGVGIDSERLMSRETAKEVIVQVLCASERSLWEKQANRKMKFEDYVTLVFSAKESLYKCVNPLVGVFFDYQDAELLNIDFSSNRFEIGLRRSLSNDFMNGMIFSGAFEINPPYIHTAIELHHN